jgi:hypothetical protein
MAKRSCYILEPKAMAITTQRQHERASKLDMDALRPIIS